MGECIFCRIAAGEIPARVVRSDDTLVAFHDVSPVAPTHVLVVPRRHVPALAATTAEDAGLLGRLLDATREIAAELGLDGYRVVVNNGETAGQSVLHLHLHLIGGRRLHWPPG